MAQTHSLDLEASSSQYAYVADSAALEISGDMTFEAWVKFETLPAAAGGSVYIANRDPDDNANRVWALRVFESGGQYKLGAYNSSGGTNATTSGQVSSAAFNLAAGTWYHLAWVFSGGNLKSYVNGMLIDSASGLNASMYTGGTAQLTIGSYDTGLSNFFDGLIKDVRIFNDERTQAEIISDAHTQGVSNANLVGEWNFNNAYTDSSGNGNTLTSSGSPVFSTDIPWTAPENVSASTALTTNLQGYWALEETSGTRADSTANNNDLADNNTVTSEAGKQGNAAVFASANSEWLGIANGSQSADLKSAGNHSVAFWIKPASTFAADGPVVWSRNNSAQDGAYVQMATVASATHIYLRIRQDASTVQTIDVTAPTAFSNGTWYHIAYSTDFTDLDARLYINGQMVANATITMTTQMATTGTFDLGSYRGGTSNFLDGDLDEFGYWNKTLGYGEALDLYNAGTGIPYDAPAPTPSVSDALTVTESVTVVHYDNITTNDTLTATENVHATLVHNVVVSDALTVAEDVSVNLVHNVVVSDALTVAEDVSVNLSITISVNDSLSLAESIVTAGFSSVSVEETVTLGETTGVEIVFFISINDTLSVAELSSGEQIFAIVAFETVSVVENISASASIGDISPNESLSIAEDILSTGTLGDISIDEPISIAESIVSNASVGDISIIDSLTIVDNISTAGTLGDVSVNDTLSVVEDNALDVMSSISASDTIVLEESVSLDVTSFPNVSDSISVSESVEVEGFLFFTVIDTSSVSENVSLESHRYSPQRPFTRPQSGRNSGPFYARAF